MGPDRVPFAQVLYDAHTLWMSFQRGDRTGLPASGALLERISRYWKGGENVSRAALALIARIEGRDGDARRILEEISTHGLASIEHDEHFLLTAAILSDVILELDDRARAAELYDVLLPYAHLLAFHDLLRTFAGSVSGELGELALVLGRYDAAVGHYEAALACEHGVGARGAELSSRVGLARVLRARGAPATSRVPSRCSARRRPSPPPSACAGESASASTPRPCASENASPFHGFRAAKHQQPIRKPSGLGRPPSRCSRPSEDTPMATAIDSPSVTPPAAGRFQARRAFRLLRELIRNPEDTDKVFEFFEAVGGDDGERHFRRLAAEPDGRRLLASRPCLVETLADEAYLASLPEDSLGRWYLRFMRARGFAPSGLLEARERGAGKRQEADAEHQWFYDRINVMHDLWHVLTGYGTDELGESALIAFSEAQIPNRSFPLLLLAAVVKGPKSWDMAWPRYLWSAYRRGRKAKLLTAACFEELLPLPVPEVRERLGIGPAALWHADGIRAGTLMRTARIREQPASSPVAASKGPA